ncbi:hypothetical protein CLIB1423_04S02850 [[Candida] railenensis]|uniref:Uncharacterized protein n=1 Tax=[Candida] railenensis TaxID=45579 RepID=A0A9P0VXL3_9ASCO|nr:hypothetical protein CLIB1423_04S02850 [[Candida] railenensis]
MESLPSENLSTIKSLLSSLSNQLNESNSHIALLESMSREIVPNEEILSQIPSPKLNDENEYNSDEGIDYEKSTIQRLEEERMSLLMDIQKQDFVTAKLNDIVQQNFEIVQSIKEYLLRSNQIHQDEIKNNNLILEKYTHNIIASNEDKLKINLVDLQIGTKRIQELLINITSSLQQNESNDYREKLNELIRGLNLLLDKEF